MPSTPESESILGCDDPGAAARTIAVFVRKSRVLDLLFAAMWHRAHEDARAAQSDPGTPRDCVRDRVAAADGRELPLAMAFIIFAPTLRLLGDQVAWRDKAAMGAIVDLARAACAAWEMSEISDIVADIEGALRAARQPGKG